MHSSVQYHFLHRTLSVHAVPLPNPETLQQLQISIIPQGVCEAKYPGLTTTMMCAGDMAGGKDACDVSA